MKIIITRKGEKIRIHHNPRDVDIHPKSKTVDVHDENCEGMETFNLVSRKTEWLDSSDGETSEVVIYLEVK